jgi:adenylate kinase
MFTSTMTRSRRPAHHLLPAAAAAVVSAPTATTCRVLLVGPPGAGKSTQGQVLATAFGVPYLSTGELLRDEARRRTPIGVHAAEYMDAGRLVPDLLARLVIEHRLSGHDDAGFVLDGYPRTRDQARRFIRSRDHAPLGCVVELAVSDAVAMERIATRSHSAARRRSDDDETVAVARLAAYREQTEPMLEFFERAGLLVSVDAERAPEVVAADLSRLVHGRPAARGGTDP